MQLSVVTSATSVKLLLEGGCGSGCSLSDEGSMLTKISLPRGATSKQLYFRLRETSTPAQSSGTRAMETVPCRKDS